MARSSCDYLVSNWSDLLRELWNLTEERGMEHGVAIYGPDGDARQSNVITGDEHSIQTPEPDARSEIGIEIHTHPTLGNLAYSENDWKSINTSLLQYPPGTDFGDSPIRGFCIMAQRFGDEERNRVSMKCATATESALNMKLKRQQDLAMSWHKVTDDMDNRMGRDQELADRFGDFINICTTTIEL